MTDETMKRGILNIWTVYQNPTDYPGKFVARRFDVDKDGPRPSASIIVAPDLETLRDISRIRITPDMPHPE